MPAGSRLSQWGLIHHPWGVISPHLGRENIDLRLARNHCSDAETCTPAGRGRWSMTEQSSMTEQDAERAVGPIDYLALELPAERMKGEGLAALVDLVDRGIIRVLDMRAVRREADGTFTE